MSPLAPLLLRGLAGPARRLLVPRAQVHSKPPREQLGTLVSRAGRRAPRGPSCRAGGGRPEGAGDVPGPPACSRFLGVPDDVSEDSSCYRD
ncbi:hypothetical protein QTO34_003272 [Cnephaeus nilssonii]|uniref:Uncharacterized protein n=1 Tax=Cnephaeus nilssonii TaxID=3371016 RepID=A0AA40HQC4_CNENI|nr:hypothetical protein QTO34_003272 [Eptesicus nilssonii]